MRVEVGMDLSDVPTPMPVIDEARMAANIARAQGYMDRLGRAFRPHIKTHKLPWVAGLQVAAGATGINCQKLTEAEVFADAGFQDILITYNMLGAARLDALHALNRRVERLAVTCDSATVVEGLAARFAGDRALTVLVECDTSAHRCGVASPAAALALAQAIDAAPGLRFGGLMTYPATGAAERVEAFLSESVALLGRSGIDCPVVTSGGTPDFYRAHLVASATEHRAGAYVYNDRSTVRAGHATAEDCALTVQATVVSRAVGGQAVLDAGSKALSSDLLGFTDYGAVEGFPAARITGLSEEHGAVDVSGCPGFPEVGEVVRVVPNHVCVVSNLFDRVIFHRDGVVTRVEEVAARGRVW